MVKCKPTTPGRRHRIGIKVAVVDINAHNKSSILRTGGRSKGRLSMRGRGGGAKHHRIIISDDSLLSLPSLIVLRILKDSRRSAPIIECRYAGSCNSLTLLLTSINGVLPGSSIFSGIIKPSSPISPGSRFYRSDIPLGTVICLISYKSRPTRARSAGTFAVLVAKEVDGYLININKRVIKVPRTSHATIGRISGSSHSKRVLGKAGVNRWLGWRPKVRGSAMNPVDHPMGGGEGKSSGGIPKSPFGKLAKGGKK